MSDNKGGRPKTVLTDEQVADVEKLSAYLNQQQIADFLEIPLRTFEAIIARDDNVSAAYKKGKSKAIGNVAQSLIKSAVNGNTSAQIFFLKTQAGWKEVQGVDLTNSDGTMKPTIIELVGVSSESKSTDTE